MFSFITCLIFWGLSKKKPAVVHIWDWDCIMIVFIIFYGKKTPVLVIIK